MLDTEYPSFKDTPFQFTLTKEAAVHNSAIIAAHKYDLLETFKSTTKNTQLAYGSEFRPAKDLEPILHHHQLWNRTKQLLLKGSTIPLLVSNPDLDKKDVTLGLQRGNHKGAKNQPKLLHKLVSKDVDHAFAMPITMETAESIKDGLWAPLNITEQWTINEQGDRIEKQRLTHDQSFMGLESGVSINDNTDEDKLEPLIYGFMFIRLIHMIHAMRLAYPSVAILLCKYDLDSAYRRMHMNAASAAKCLCMTAVCALIYLRLTFGGTSSPAEWCVIIEILTDLGNDIINNPHWDHTHTFAKEPDPSMLRPPLLNPPTDEFVQALPADVHLHLPRHGWVDSYIDDLIGVCLHIGSNAIRTTKAILLAIYIMARPSSSTPPPILHKYLLAIAKMIAEGQQTEVKIVLGWRINTRAFLVQLPQDKFVSYTRQLKEVIRIKKSSNDNLQSIIGRLERVTYAVPHSRFFLNRLRHLQLRTEGQQIVHIPSSVMEDLHIFIIFINYARIGTSINNLVFRRPSHFCWSDSCPFGLGGYTATGLAWRFYIPPSLRSEHTNNVLEFMAAIVTIWIDILTGGLPHFACILGCSDSSSTVGWMHRSNFNQSAKPVHGDLARHLARILMSAHCTLYSQHQKGRFNVIADILSRWFFLTNTDLTHFLHSNYNTQMPTNFRISPLPSVISSWIISTLGKLQKTTACKMKRTKVAREHGNGGCPGWKMWASRETPILLGLPVLKEPDWLEALQSASADANTVLQDTRSHWLQGQSTRPSLTWRRPFRTTTNPTPDLTPMETSTPTSSPSPDHSKNATRKKKRRRR